jgi:hypothetical protein
MNDEKFIEFINQANIHFGIIHRVGSLLLMYSLTEDKLNEFSNEVVWYDKNDTRADNKHRMKETGRMLNGYRQCTKELIIIGLAKTIEDLLYDIEDKFQLKLNFLTDFEGCNCYEEMRIIRYLNNCIKHNKGKIERGNSSGNYLIDNAGFEEGSNINDIEIDVEDFILKSFVFQMDIFYKQTNKENPYLKSKDKYDDIKTILIPSFIKI